MQIHQIQPVHKRKKARRVGRGGAKGGTYAGKGGKGQTRRAGFNVAPIVRELVKRYPKRKGYRKRGRRSMFHEVTLSALERNFEQGSLITPALLLEKRIVRRVRGRTPQIKIIGAGPAQKVLKIDGCAASAAAKKAVLAAGGTFT
ncbi:MAG: uL15 family ribosomal protein [Candidatus Wildermuthbacteria bacterium]|nr:uL15 family ribosomal protein [Candidatus Wildermuthbacteria bacterium]